MNVGSSFVFFIGASLRNMEQQNITWRFGGKCHSDDTELCFSLSTKSSEIQDDSQYLETVIGSMSANKLKFITDKVEVFGGLRTRLH